MVDLINLGDSFWLPEGTNLIAGRQESSNNLSQDKNTTEKGPFSFLSSTQYTAVLYN